MIQNLRRVVNIEVEQRFCRSVLVMLVCLSVGGCGKFIYGVDMYNYGHSGVMLLQVGSRLAYKVHPAFEADGVTVPMIRGFDTNVPSLYRNPASYFGRFQGYETSLPEEDVEIVWQLADLTDCEDEYRVSADEDRIVENLRGRDFGRSEFYIRRKCTWTPRPDRVFRQKIDMRAIRNSKEYKKTGRRNPDAVGRFTLNIKLIFIEERMVVEIGNGATNPAL